MSARTPLFKDKAHAPRWWGAAVVALLALPAVWLLLGEEHKQAAGDAVKQVHRAAGSRMAAAQRERDLELELEVQRQVTASHIQKEQEANARAAMVGAPDEGFGNDPDKRIDPFEYKEFCNSLGDKYNEWCDQNIGDEGERIYQEYKEQRRKCKWRTTGDFWARHNDFATDLDWFDGEINPLQWQNVLDASAGDRSHMTKQHGLMKMDCSFKGRRGTWHVSRVGPIKQVPGKKSWHNVWWDAFPQLAQEPGKGSMKRFVTGSLLSVTTSDKEMDIIPYPPVHMHHAHLYYTDPKAPFHPHTPFISETHGDASCPSGGRGPSCYMWNMPKGYGVIAPERFFADSMVNFVTEGEQEFWFDYSVQVLGEDEEEAASTETVFHFPIGIYDFNPVEYRRANTYKVPKTGVSVNWNTMHVPMDSEIMWWKWHVHAYYVDDVWIIKAPDSALGLGRGKYVLKEDPLPKEIRLNTSEGHCPVHTPSVLRGQIFNAEEKGVSLHEVKASILLHLERYRAEGHPDARVLYKLGDVRDSHEVFDGFWAARRPLQRVDEHFLKASDDITVVAFHRPMFGVVPEEAPDVMMHIKFACVLRPDFSAFGGDDEDEDGEEEAGGGGGSGAAAGGKKSPLEGDWKLEVPQPDGSLDYPTLSFKDEGGKIHAYLEGSVYTGEVSKLKVDGAKYSYSFKAPTPLGFKVTVPMSGEVKGDSLSGELKTPFGTSKYKGDRQAE